MNRGIPRCIADPGTQVMTCCDVDAVKPESGSFDEHAPVIVVVFWAAGEEDVGRDERAEIVDAEFFV